MEQKWLTNYDNLHEFEKLKLKQDGLDILKELPKYKDSGFDAIDPNNRDLLKWAGVYVQRPRSDGHFMMRVKIPSGVMNSLQARTLAQIAKDYGRGFMDLTTRQAIQYHWLTVENIPVVMDMLKEVNLDTIEACGDCPRTVTGNPLSGIDPDETMDTGEIVQQVFDYFQANREFSNLPRKFKLSISANIYNAGHAQINDLAFTPAVKKIGEEEVYGFHVYVGGGLTRNPFIAQKLDLFVRPEEVLKVAIAVVTIYRDYGNRTNRRKARFKFLVADWGREKFEQEVLKITGHLEKAGKDLTAGWNAGYFYGVHPQKQLGLNYVGLSVPLGRLSAEDLFALADCADKYGDGSIRTSLSKNFILANIPEEKVGQLLKEEIIKSFTPNPKPFLGHTVACTGKDFCNLALVETKEFAWKLAQSLDEKIAIDTPIRIHVNGCPNACGQFQIADIGLRGAIGKVNGEVVEKFEFSIGGNLGENTTFATSLQGSVPAEKVEEVFLDFVNYYKDNRNGSEIFHEFVSRVGVEPFQELLNNHIDMSTSPKLASK